MKQAKILTDLSSISIADMYERVTSLNSESQPALKVYHGGYSAAPRKPEPNRKTPTFIDFVVKQSLSPGPARYSTLLPPLAHRYSFGVKLKSVFEVGKSPVPGVGHYQLESPAKPPGKGQKAASRILYLEGL